MISLVLTGLRIIFSYLLSYDNRVVVCNEAANGLTAPNGVKPVKCTIAVLWWTQIFIITLFFFAIFLCLFKFFFELKIKTVRKKNTVAKCQLILFINTYLYIKYNSIYFYNLLPSISSQLPKKKKKKKNKRTNTVA